MMNANMVGNHPCGWGRIVPPTMAISRMPEARCLSESEFSDSYTKDTREHDGVEESDRKNVAELC